MTFKKGESGNVAGRPKGILNKRTQLAKLFEPHASDLIAKAIELALAGDVQALKLCLDKLIPKAEHFPIEIDLPAQLDLTNLYDLKSMLLQAVLEGKLSISHAEKFIAFAGHLVEINPPPIQSCDFPTDPNEAARIYREFMRA
ncbi:MAG: DUF5681 domain-containing protein [Gammaproteobacteria bacterium]